MKEFKMPYNKLLINLVRSVSQENIKTRSATLPHCMASRCGQKYEKKYYN